MYDEVATKACYKWDGFTFLMAKFAMPSKHMSRTLENTPHFEW